MQRLLVFSCLVKLIDFQLPQFLKSLVKQGSYSSLGFYD